MKALFEQFAAIAAAATVSLIALAVVHEYGYFLYVGRSFQPLISATDYLGNAILWLPVALMLSYTWLRGLLNEKDDGAKDVKKWQAWLFFILVFICIVLSAMFSHDIFFPTFLTVLLFASVWSVYRPRTLAALAGNQAAEKILRPTLRIVPPVVVTIFAIGFYNGYNAIEGHHSPYLFRVVGDENTRLRIFLRNLDKGALVFDKSKRRVEFYQWEHILLVSNPLEQPRYNIACRVFGYYCPEVTPDI